MVKRIFAFFGAVLAGFWRTIDVLRRVVLNAVFLLLLAFVVVLLWRALPAVPDGAALVLRPAGPLVEQKTFETPLDLLRNGGVAPSQTVLHDLLEAVEAARDDTRIKALVIETDRLGPTGLSKLAELRAAIVAFRQSGKPVFARGERFTQGQYYLASAADEVHVGPDGFVLLQGLARYISYFAEALDKLGVKMHVFRVGEYKAFSEPFTRNDMSEADREASRDLLEGLWTGVREDLIASRRLAPEKLDAYVNAYPAALAATGGDAVSAARDAGLIDRASTRDEWRELLKARVGASEDGKDFRRVEADDYLAVVRATRPEQDDHVAVLVAQGAIIDGSDTQSAVGGDSLAHLIRMAREDERVKALVLRVDSPGGSAWASEVIRRELELTREAGKPVVASMSSVAASGGYWIATGAEEIFASPASLTGSIGIFALFPELAGALDKLGVNTDGVATGPLAGAFDPRRPLEPAAAKTIQLGIEHGYRRFLETVAKARDMSATEVDTVARGRVWTGEAATKLGLVDQLGGLEAAVAAAASRAGLKRYETVWPRADVGPGQRLLQRFVAALAPVGGLSVLSGLPASPLAVVIGGLQQDANELLRWNDPRHLYTHCLCEAL
ncbi:Protease IV [Aromatoleum aromaticum EbN1]|uniref:Protease IV n=1 Tax=Aromatoleum aromaticum (strain DSM 19018 / LMG 30748 / EbN1) TaxID=76114 RepID=Q5P5J3_AROAE|nr:signal peptide peptidase SppA [Aromatoleum aromaticum]CAI07419.1 Protease IV [Aromatoleum aromaticum EbN1]